MKKYKITAAVLTILLILPVFVTVGSAAGPENLYAFGSSYAGTVKTDGTELFDPGYHTSGYIAVKPGDTLTLAPVYPDQTLYITVYGSGKNVTKRLTAYSSLTEKEKFPDGAAVCSYTLPAGAAYVRLTCAAAVCNTFLASQTAFTAEEYNVFIASAGLSRFAAFRENEYGKHGGALLWCGDSIGVGYYEYNYPGTAGTDCTSKHRNDGVSPAWAKRVASLLGVTEVKNTSKGGASLSTKRADVANIYTQIKDNASDKYDYVVIEGGSVDVGGSNGIKAPLGTMSKSYELSSFDGEDTFIGALERAFYYATKQAPRAKILFVIPYSMPKHKNNANAWNEYWYTVPYVCEKWGVPYVDVYNDGYINSVFDTNRTPDGSSPTAFYYDTLHISPMGYSLTSLVIAEKAAAITPYSTADRKPPQDIPDTPETTAGGEDRPSPASLVNLFDAGKSFAGRIDRDGTEIADAAKYKTTHFIPVKSGDKLYFGPADTGQGYQLSAFASDKTVASGWIKGASLDTVSTFGDGRVIYRYTVPSGVSYVRITVPVKYNSLVTVNQEFTAQGYEDFFNPPETTAAPATTPADTGTDAPSDTTAPLPTTDAPDTTEPTDTVPDSAPDSAPDTEPVGNKGCASFCLLPAFLLLPLPFVIKKFRI